MDFKSLLKHGISIDSRTIRKGEAFVAIKGNRFDGHLFVNEAFNKGAAAAIVQNKIQMTKFKAQNKLKIKKSKIIYVKNTLKTLGDIAAYKRRQFNIPVIGITGSTGKSTVKEIVSYLLNHKFDILKNEGTENNLIGLPLTILKLKKKHEIAVLEMGTNHPGEIKRLTEIARPSIGIITNIGASHLEFLKNEKNVFKAKSELLRSMDSGGLALLNKDDNFLRNAKTKCRKIFFGIEKDSEFRATGIKEDKNGISFKTGDVIFNVALIGRHNVYNALAGIAIGHIFGMKLPEISKILKNFRNPFRNRLCPLKGKRMDIIDDTYNSNPLSFQKAVDTLCKIAAGRRKIVIAGDMLELGGKSGYFHRQLGRYAARSGADMLLAVGSFAQYAREGAVKAGMKPKKAIDFRDFKILITRLPRILRKGDMILVKGSRGMHMEEITNVIPLIVPVK